MTRILFSLLLFFTATALTAQDTTWMEIRTAKKVENYKFDDHGRTFIYEPAPAPHAVFRFKLDKAGLRDSLWLSYYSSGQTADSGYYSHGKKTGLWLRWYNGGKVAAREYFNGKDSVPYHFVYYYVTGYTSDSAWLRKDSRGYYWYVKHWDMNGKLAEVKETYPGGRGHLVSKHILFDPEYPFNRQAPLELVREPGSNDVLTTPRLYATNPQHMPGCDSTIAYCFDDRTHIDSVFSAKGFLHSVKTPTHYKTFFPNGKINDYISHDTILQYFDNGQLARAEYLFAGHLFPMAQGPGIVLPDGLTRIYAADGSLLNEYYEYPNVFYSEGKIRCADELGRIIAEGATDKNGFRQGSWKMYRWTGKGEFYVSEEGNYDHGCRTGKWKMWHANGQRRGEAQYAIREFKAYPNSLYSENIPRGDCDRFILTKNKKRYIKARHSFLTGDYTEYTTDGHIKAQAHFSETGKYQGEWTYADTAGNVLSKRYYNNGLLCDSLYWKNKKGEMIEKQYFSKPGENFRSVRWIDSYMGGGKKIEFFKSNSLIEIDPPDPMKRFITSTDGIGGVVANGLSRKTHRRYEKRYKRRRPFSKLFYRLKWGEPHGWM